MEPAQPARTGELIRFPYLDGLRGIAVLIVIIGHYSIFSPYFGPILGPTAKTGVWLFFLLSAFLLTRQMILTYRNEVSLDATMRYLARRALRILPLYYLVLGLLVALPAFAKSMFGQIEFSMANHFFLLYPQGIFWAISVEFEYYLIIPILALVFTACARLHRHLGLGLGLSLLVIATLHYRWVDLYKSFPANYPHLANYTHFFLTGSALAIIFQHRSHLATRETYASMVAFIVAVAWQVFVIPFPFRDSLLAAIGFPPNWWHWMAQHMGQLLSCATVLTSILLSNRLQKWFSLPLLRFFGKISFSMYCLHILPTAYLGWLVPIIGPFASALAFFVITTALSVFTYRFIELPFIDLVRAPIPTAGTNHKCMIRPSEVVLGQPTTFT